MAFLNTRVPSVGRGLPPLSLPHPLPPSRGSASSACARLWVRPLSPLHQHCRVLRPFAFSFCCCCFLFPAMCFYCINFYGLLPPLLLLLPLPLLLLLPLLRFLAAAFVLLCVCPKVIKWIGFSRIISILNPVSKSAQAMPPSLSLSLSFILPHCSSCPREALCQLSTLIVVVLGKVASFCRIKLFCKVCWDLFGDSICNCFCFPCISSLVAFVVIVIAVATVVVVVVVDVVVAVAFYLHLVSNTNAARHCQRGLKI